MYETGRKSLHGKCLKVEDCSRNGRINVEALKHPYIKLKNPYIKNPF
jgi:hypothetical protein